MASRQSHTFRLYPRGAIFLSLVLVVAAAAEPAGKQKEPAAPLDRYGDALPPGAKARLGMLWLQRDMNADRACFGLSPDGKTIVTFSHGRCLKWWDADTGKLREQRQLPLKSPFFIACLSFDGRLLAGQERGTDNLDVWDVRAGKRVQRLEGPKQSAIYWMMFAPDGKTLAAQGSQDRIFLWDIASGKRSTLQGGTFAFSPDGKRLASTLAGRVICWDTKKGEQIWQAEARFFAPGWVSLAFTPNGRTLIAAPQTDTDAWHAWDAATGKVAEGLKLPDKLEANDLAFTADGRTLVLVRHRGVYIAPLGFRHIRLWDLREGKLLHTLPASGDLGPFFPDGKSFLSNDGALQRWELATGRPLFAQSYKLGHQAGVFRAIYSPDGRRLASADHEGMVRLWDVATTKTLHVLRGHGRDCSMAFTPDGKFLITGAIEGKVHVWDAENGKLVRRIPLRDPKDKVKDAPVWRLQVTPDGRTLLVLEYTPHWSDSGTSVLSRWNLATGERKARAKVEANLIASVFSCDGQMLVVEKELLDTATLTRRALLEEKGASEFGGCYALSADGRMAAGLIVRQTEKEDKEERRRIITTVEGFSVWETATGRTRRRILLDKERQFRLTERAYEEDMPLALSPDGRYLAAVDQQGLLVWDLFAAGKVVVDQPATELMRDNALNLRFACCLCFAPDGRTLTTGNVDSTVLIWNLPLDGSIAGTKALPLPAVRLQSLWEDLARKDAAKAFEAICVLTAAAEQAVPLLKTKLTPMSLREQQRIARLIADLDSDEFAVREAATKQLRQRGDGIEPTLRQALKDKPRLEVRRRIEALLEDMPASAVSPAVRELRAVEVLEHIGRPEARALLKTLAEGLPAARRTREAKAALQRLDHRHSPKP